MGKDTEKLDKAIDLLKNEVKKDDAELKTEILDVEYLNSKNTTSENETDDDDIEVLFYEEDKKKEEIPFISEKTELTQEELLSDTKEIEKIDTIETEEYIYNDVDCMEQQQIIDTNIVDDKDSNDDIEQIDNNLQYKEITDTNTLENEDSNILEDEIDDNNDNTSIVEDNNQYDDVLEEDKKVVDEVAEKKKKMLFRIIITAIFLIDLIVLLVILLNTIANNPNFAKTRGQLLKQQKKTLNDYGSALENMVGIYYQQNKVILKYEAVAKLVKFDQEVVCAEQEVYNNGKLYLNNCRINGTKTSYSYGTKQEVSQKKTNSKSARSFDVFLDNKTGIFTLQKQNANTVYDTFKITCDSTCTDFDIVASRYITYFDEKHNAHMKDIRDDSEVLPTLNYTSVLPIKTSFDYDYDYAAFKVDNKWGIYNYKNGLAAVGPTYDSMSIDLSSGIEQSIKHISALGNTTNIAISNNGKVGVINYKSGQTIIDAKYNKVIRSGNYLNCLLKDSTSEVYDFNGSRYFTGIFDKIYGIVDDSYILVEVNKQTRIIQFDGNILYNFGSTSHGDFNFFISYNNGALFQFYKDNKNKKDCINYIYSNGVGTVKESGCNVVKF